MNLEIYGSYEKSLSESKTITGHDNIKYVVGGNARYATRSNIIDWQSVSTSHFGTTQIKIINDIFNFPEYISDQETLLVLLYEINKLKSSNFYKLLENSLNLKESLVIQLRRMFYIIDAICTKQNITNALTHNYTRPTEFCQYEPVKRIHILLEHWRETDTNCTTLYAALKPLIIQFIKLTQQKHKLLSTPLKKSSVKQTIDLVAEMSTFVSRYKKSYDTLHTIENTNVKIACVLESINAVLESF